MNRMLLHRWFIIWLCLTLPLISGCASKPSLKRLQDRELRTEISTDSGYTTQIEQLRKKVQTKNENNFWRQLSLTFTASDHKVTPLQEKIIKLFFQTLPTDEYDVKVKILVAPSSTQESFNALQEAWKRLRSLEKAISAYSSEIELIYQPSLEKDTATMQVTGGGSV